VLRSAIFLVFFAVAVCVSALPSQTDSALESYFTGKQVLIKIDMPGSQKGIDLRYNKPTPMDWKEYGSRLKQFGASIRKGDTARITAFNVKKDMIEFQLDGGGFGTARDDANATVAPTVVDKSDYEKDLERQIANTDDEDRKRSLQKDLDRERSRREHTNADNQRAAQVASQIKAQAIQANRNTGGSRFNLRWSGSIPPDQLTPEAIVKLLADYVDFNAGQASANPATGNVNPAPGNAANPPDSAVSNEPAGSPTAQLKRGMRMEDVTTLLGPGKELSSSVGDAGLKTQVFEYLTPDRRVEITYVDALLVRFSISSR
jgi:hypothetical protein